MCGVKEILSCIKSLISGLGSFSKVSKAANDKCPESKALTKATSSITPPLAALIIPAPFSS